MTTTQKLSREQLLEQAHDAEVEEVAYLDQLKNIPARVAEARRAAEGRFAVQNAEKLAGRSTDEPVLDYSEVSSIQNGVYEIKASAKAAGIRKLRLYAALHNHEAEAHRTTFDSMAAPLEELELQAARVNNDLKALRNARAVAIKKHEQSWGAAQEYSRAAAFAESASEPIRRL